MTVILWMDCMAMFFCFIYSVLSALCFIVADPLTTPKRKTMEFPIDSLVVLFDLFLNQY
jgi:hypothetical protein